MPLREFQHTSAEQQRRFQRLSIDEQMLEIWLNGNETNGHVAELRRDVDVDNLRIKALEDARKREDGRMAEYRGAQGFRREVGAWLTAVLVSTGAMVGLIAAIIKISEFIRG